MDKRLYRRHHVELPLWCSGTTGVSTATGYASGYSQGQQYRNYIEGLRCKGYMADLRSRRDIDIKLRPTSFDVGELIYGNDLDNLFIPNQIDLSSKDAGVLLVEEFKKLHAHITKNPNGYARTTDFFYESQIKKNLSPKGYRFTDFYKIMDNAAEIEITWNPKVMPRTLGWGGPFYRSFNGTSATLNGKFNYHGAKAKLSHSPAINWGGITIAAFVPYNQANNVRNEAANIFIRDLVNYIISR